MVVVQIEELLFGPAPYLDLELRDDAFRPVDVEDVTDRAVGPLIMLFVEVTRVHGDGRCEVLLRDAPVIGVVLEGEFLAAVAYLDLARQVEGRVLRLAVGAPFGADARVAPFAVEGVARVADEEVGVGASRT